MDGDLGHFRPQSTQNLSHGASAFQLLGTFPQLPETAPPAHPWLQLWAAFSVNAAVWW